jgi:hypothetical protein
MDRFLKLVVLILFLLPGLLRAVEASPGALILAGCRVYTELGKPMLQLPGHECLLLADGSFISAGKSGLRRFSPMRELLWHLAGNYRQLNFSSDKQKILAIASEVRELGGKKKRIDVMSVVSLEGEILYSQDSTYLGKIRKAQLQNDLPRFIKESLGVEAEVSRINSFYEVGPTVGKTHPAIKPGNFVINGLDQGFFILSPDLSKVLYHGAIPSPRDHRVYDLQVTSGGGLLYFKTHKGSAGYPGHSAIEELDPITGKINEVFSAQDKPFFYAPAGGGVQSIDDDILVFHDTNLAVFFFSRKRNKIYKSLTHIHQWPLYHTPLSNLKLLLKNEFFEHWPP